MLLDSGLNNAAKYPYSSTSNQSTNYQWVRYTAVGTSGAAPAAAQTALGAEVARTQDHGGFQPSDVYERDVVNKVLRAKHTNTRVINFATAYNLSEFGHAPSSSGGSFTYRDLFRQDPNDPASTPVTISVQPGDQLQLSHTQIIEYEWEALAQNITLTGLPGNDGAGSFTGTGSFIATLDNQVSPLISSFWPGSQFPGYLAVVSAANASIDPASDVPVVSGSQGALWTEAYVDGTFYREHKPTLPTSAANGPVYGLALSYTSSTNTTSIVRGYKFVFSNPASFTKASTHTLSATFRMSWGRG